MIIDIILDRKNGVPYDARNFYVALGEYGEIGNDIAEALDVGEDEDIKRELCAYVIENDYNADICHYINSVSWLKHE